MRILGIDPGLSGALALVEDGRLVELVDIEASDSRINAAHLASLVQRWSPDFAVCEVVTARPGQGVTSMFTFGHGLGTITAVLSTLGIPHLLIRPQAWQSHFGIEASSKDKTEHKREIADRAEALYPGAPLYGPKGGLRDGRSDALLLAHYAHEHLSSMPPEAFRDAHAVKPTKTTKKKRKLKNSAATHSGTVAL
jgi:crossover junction endodeoxyribonuclease RuvC